MADQKTYDTLNQIFADVFLDDSIRLDPETTAKDIEGWDSFKQLDIIFAVEERYGFKLTSQEIDQLYNVGALADIIERHLAQA